MPLDQQHIEEEEHEMSFFDHIEVLRKHIVRSLVAILSVAVLAFLNKDFVFNTVIFGPRHNDFPTYRFFCNLSERFGLGDTLCIQPKPFQILSKDLGEIFMTSFTVSFWIGLIVAFPIVFWEFWKFVRPALKKSEADSARWAVWVCSLLFSMGVIFGYFVIAPFSINFLSNYTIEGADMAPTLNSYVTYMTMFTVPVGMLFQMPVVVYFFAHIGLLGPEMMRTYRRHAIVVVFIFSAIITPPDVMSQLFIAMPIIGLYEVSIRVAKRVSARREAELKA